MKDGPEVIKTNVDRPNLGAMISEALPQLLFELTHGWRLEILLTMGQSPRRHTDVSKGLGLSPQEATRHLLRLAEVKLIEKNAGGLYHLTNLGRLVLTLIPPLNVIAKYADFFLAHDISGIPYEFILRLGELSNSDIQKTDTLSTLSKAFQTLRRAEGQIYLINVGYLEFTGSVIDKKGGNVEYKCILPVKLAGVVPKRTGVREECRYLNDVKLGMILTEELAAISLPDLQGKMDYTVFLRSNDLAFKNWCRNLFEDHWTKADPKLIATRPSSK